MFRPIQRQDIPELKELCDSLFQVKYSDTFYNGLLNTDYITRVAIHEGNIVGLVTGTIRPSTRLHCGKRDDCYISTLGVKEGYRRRGYASLLLTRFIGLVKSMHGDSMSLDVLTTNTAALSLYTKHGFSISENLPSYYHFDGAYHDAYHLSMRFESREWCSVQ